MGGCAFDRSPSAVARLLPEAVRPLLLDASSPLADLYPRTFKTDQNGKINDWEAVVLIPFVTAGRIQDALTPLLATLDEHAIARNKHGPRHVGARREADTKCELGGMRCSDARLWPGACRPCEIAVGS